MHDVNSDDLIFGYEFFEKNENGIDYVSWPNAWPINENDINELLKEHDYKNKSGLDNIDIVKYYLKEYNFDQFFLNESVKNNFTKQLSVNDINDKKYIFPVKMYGSIWIEYDFFKKKGIYLSQKVKNDCINGLCKILIYDLAEGHGYANEFINDFIETQSKIHSIPKNSFIYSDANYLTPKLQKKYGSYGIFRTLGDCGDLRDGMLTKNQYSDRVNFNKNPYNIPYYFLCMNRRKAYHRIEIGSEIFKGRWGETILWSMGKFNIEGDDYTIIGDDIVIKIEDIDEKILVNKKFYELLPINIDIDFTHLDNYENEQLSVNFKLDNHVKSYINIVTETKFYEDNTIFLSEKTFKPILAIQPFIIVGTPHSLKLLKDLGYKTFHPFINEEYDNIENHKIRMDFIMNEIDRLYNLNTDEMHNLIKQCSDICIYNYNHLIKIRNENIRDLNHINDIKNILYNN